VTRQPIDVRRAGAGDVDDVARLWCIARQDVNPSARPAGGAVPEQLRMRLREALLGDEVQVVIARWDARAVGYAVLRLAPAAALADGLALQIEHLFVIPELRRHGVARSLLSVVTGIAERAGAEQIVSSAPPGARDTHRFLARLGFSPVVVRRVAATSVLRRKLAGEGRRGGLDDLLSRRRSLRARASWPHRGEGQRAAGGHRAPVAKGGPVPVAGPAAVAGDRPVAVAGDHPVPLADAVELPVAPAAGDVPTLSLGVPAAALGGGRACRRSVGRAP
jgi:GNAT superfamily N-acetyltransferase